MSDPFDGVREARALLESQGFVVLREKSYRQAQERQRVADCMARMEAESAEHAREWARAILDGERILRDRCTYLYGLAASLGASDNELHHVRIEPLIVAS